MKHHLHEFIKRDCRLENLDKKETFVAILAHFSISLSISFTYTVNSQTEKKKLGRKT